MTSQNSNTHLVIPFKQNYQQTTANKRLFVTSLINNTGGKQNPFMSV